MICSSFYDLAVQHAGLTQSLLYVLIIVSLWFVEKRVSAQPLKDKWQHSSVNALCITLALPVQLLMTLLLSMAANWVTAKNWGLIRWVPAHHHPWLQGLVLFVALDLCEYVYHRAMHLFSGFWRFHRVHHSDQVLDVSTTLREHPGETLVRNSFLLLWVLILGAPFWVLVLRQTVQTVSNILAHTHLRLPERTARVMGWLFITPNLHHVHHHFQQPQTDCNYGDVFSIWDRILGTYAELPVEETVFGLDTHMDAERTSSFRDVARMPFDPRPWSPCKGSAVD